MCFEAALGKNIKSIRTQFEEIIKYDEPYLISHLKINGNTLKEMGVHGLKIGEALKFLQNIVIENKDLNEQEKLKEKINRFLP